MALMRWNPFDEMFSLQKEIENLFDQKRLQTKALDKTKELVDWYPAVDIHEDNNGFYLDVEAPGVSKDQFDVKVHDGVLTIRGERKHEEEKKDKNIYRSERVYGRFERSFTLPPVADSAKIEAEYKNGVLALKIPKKEVAKPAQIEVKVKE